MAKNSKKADAAYAEALRRIEVCSAMQQSTNLFLNGLGLTTLPPEISQLKVLTTLQLHDNQLAALPPEISQLKALTTLYLNSNQLTTLPPEIGQLTALTTLHLDHNQLTTLPPEIGQLTALTTLHLHNNHLTTLPSEIGQLGAMTTLDLDYNHLTTLDLDYNHLTTLPPEIDQLKALTTLSLSDNQLRTLPPEIGQLKALKTLPLFGNQLTTLPPEIGQLKVLTELSLQRNQLTTLPPEIGQLTRLTKLFLHGNPALAIPDSILGPTFSEVHGRVRMKAARPHDILNFYFAQHHGAVAGTLRAVKEIKVMLVGRGGAGKTSLRRYFMGEPHDKGELETPGIALNSFPLPCSRGEMTVRLWDFAGQEITHALHHFFLTEGCVYILVLDPRSNTEMQDAEYWLGLLKRYASGAPVLVALNKQDARQGGYDVDRRMLQERFPFLRSFTLTNCERREGCDELKQRLCDAIDSLKETEPPHLKVPETWLKVMKACAGEAHGTSHSTGNRLLRWLGLAGHAVPSDKGRQYLTLEQFCGICSEQGETEPIKQESLARLLHMLGAVLHFVDEPRLRDTAVLNPHWVTDGVYRLLRFKDRPGSDGTLTLDEALQALPGEEEKEARFLLRLMERFEMCFPLDQEEGDKPPTKWLIPGALGEFQPAGVTTNWQRPGSVRLRYLYDPLPEGVLPRFIVMTNLLSEGQPRWRNGVVLVDGAASALVRRGEKRNHVEVTAFGPDAERLRLLEIIQGNLERIHSDLPDPKPVAEMELAGLPGTFRPVADLEAAERQHMRVAVKTPEFETQVDPTSQLNQTSEPAARDETRVPLNAFLSYSHEDKKAKGVFQQNFTVMMKKKFIAPWHDGLIEPGMRWREEINENLEKMDVFVGLLTTAFLASDFIEAVELKAARDRLAEEHRDFLFVLILVDDGISLEGLEDAGYQILKPGGKAVSRHKNRREGFNVAQQELEELLRKRQADKEEQKRDTPNLSPLITRADEKQGVTILTAKGQSLSAGPVANEGDSLHIDGGRLNRQVVETLTRCTNMVRQQAPGQRKDLLETLTRDVQQLIESLPDDRKQDAQDVADNWETLVKQASKAEPDQRWYSLSAEGLLEASQWAKDSTGNMGGTLLSLGKSFWPDFQIPESK